MKVKIFLAFAIVMCCSATINASPKLKLPLLKYLPTRYRFNPVLQPIARYQSFVSIPTAVVYPPLAPAPFLPLPLPLPHVLPPPVLPAPHIAVLPPVVAPPPVVVPPAPLPVYGEPLHF